MVSIKLPNLRKVVTLKTEEQSPRAIDLQLGRLPQEWCNVPVPLSFPSDAGFDFPKEYLTVKYRSARMFRGCLRVGDVVFWLAPDNKSTLSGELRDILGPDNGKESPLVVVQDSGGSKITMSADRILRADRGC